MEILIIIFVIFVIIVIFNILFEWSDEILDILFSFLDDILNICIDFLMIIISPIRLLVDKIVDISVKQKEKKANRLLEDAELNDQLSALVKEYKC